MADTTLTDDIIDIPLPPTQDELPWDDGMPMETARHRQQMNLLIDPLHRWLDSRGVDGYVGGNMFVYFSMEQVRSQSFRGPDVYVVLGVPGGERKCWVVWEEGKGPDVVIELLSPKTARADKGEKKRVYQDQLKVAEYYWFDPFNPDDFAGFDLRHGVYEPLEPDGRGRLVSRRLGLALVRWQGVYEGVEATWLRWADADGEPLPTDREALEAERRRADAEAQRAAAAEAEVARLKALLDGRNSA